MRMFILAVTWLFYAGHLEGLPAQVIIIRHAEKPHQGNNLSLKGRERAAAFAPYFTENPDVTVFGTPVAIYAQAAPTTDASVRSIETVTPLAATLKLSVNNSFGRDDYPKMVQEIKNHPQYHGRMVLICWEHQVIPEIARAFGASQVPSRWPGNAFDRLWILGIQGNRATFRNLPQRLLYGDSTN